MTKRFGSKSFILLCVTILWLIFIILNVLFFNIRGTSLWITTAIYTLLYCSILFVPEKFLRKHMNIRMKLHKNEIDQWIKKEMKEIEKI
jgi:hypothetical protein